MTNILQLIAERRISEALQEGRLKIERWRGKPLPLEDEGRVPPELRMAYKIVKNAGYLPPEIETRKQIQQLEELIAASEDEQVRVKQYMRRRPLNLEENEDYYRKVVARVTLRSGSREQKEK